MTSGVSLLELTTSAGLDDDDLGFVPEVEAVDVVEDLEDGVIRQHILIFRAERRPTDSAQDAVRHEHKERAV